MFVTPPNGEVVDMEVPGRTIGGPAGQGDQVFFAMDEVRARAGPGTFEVEAFLPQELGGDHTARTLEIE
jgi:hypothetical protein